MVKICDQYLNAGSFQAFEPLPTPAKRQPLGTTPVFASLSNPTLLNAAVLSSNAVSALEDADERERVKPPKPAVIDTSSSSSNRDPTSGAASEVVVPTPITLSIRVMGNTKLRMAHNDVYGGNRIVACCFFPIVLVYLCADIVLTVYHHHTL